jgi:SAM-dependent methyltransferase
MTPRLVARQLSHPHGLFGHIIGWLMNRHNAGMNAFALRQLDPKPGDRILEIGFGGGVMLKPLIESGAFVAGLDRSRDMVGRAKYLWREAVAAGCAEFRKGRVEALPFEEASFTKICSVNTIYFWQSLDKGFEQIHRTLLIGGRAVIGFLPKERMDRMGMPTDIFTTRAPDEVARSMTKAGFQNVRILQPAPSTSWNVIVADKV